MGWVDLHVHILPGIDDGSQDLETSLQMGEALYRLGFDTLCATPHVKQGVWDGQREEVEALTRVIEDELLGRLRPPGNGDEVNLRVITGGEHFLDASFFRRVEEKRLLEYPLERAVLVELSLMPGASHAGVREALFRVRVQGIRPVLAHPERYDASHRSIDWIEQLRDDGVSMLCDLLSLAGRSGRASRRAFERMVDRDLVDGVCSDAHGVGDVHALDVALPRLERMAGSAGLERYLTWGRALTG